MIKKLQESVLPIKLEKSEERLTSLAGLVVVEELARRKGLWRRVDELFPEPGWDATIICAEKREAECVRAGEKLVDCNARFIDTTHVQTPQGGGKSISRTTTSIVTVH